jgi:phospholipid transport system substrate-binding protein
MEQFRLLLVRTYGRALSEYADEKVIYLPFDSGSEADRVTVRTEIEQAGGTPIPISYSMYLSDNGWKVYDVAISGVSLVTNYRSSFGSIIRKDGMDSLIEQLGNRNRREPHG